MFRGGLAAIPVTDVEQATNRKPRPDGASLVPASPALAAKPTREPRVVAPSGQDNDGGGSKDDEAAEEGSLMSLAMQDEYRPTADDVGKR